MLCNSCGKEIGSAAGMCDECTARGHHASRLHSVQASVARYSFRKRSFKALIFVGSVTLICLIVFLILQKSGKELLPVSRKASPSIGSVPRVNYVASTEEESVLDLAAGGSVSAGADDQGDLADLPE